MVANKIRMFNTKFKSSIESSPSQAAIVNPPDIKIDDWENQNLDIKSTQKTVKSSIHLVKSKQKFNYIPKGKRLLNIFIFMLIEKPKFEYKTNRDVKSRMTKYIPANTTQK